ncbi:MAG: ABC transporter permease [Paenibacillaceae bacterium]|nr:ABC transporter permease [Paenibacillaceae bacterium]
MIRLLALEWRKWKFRGFLWAGLAACAALTFWCVGNQGGNTGGYRNYGDAFAEIGMYAMSTFVVFAAVLLARVVIDEYRNKTIGVLFGYPVRRYKLLAAKLALVALLTFGMTLVANALVSAVLLWREHAWPSFSSPEPLTRAILAEEAGRIAIHAATAAGMGLLPLYAGMLRKSVAATIVPSFFFVMLSSGIYSRDEALPMRTEAWLALAWLAAGAALSVLALRRAEREDVG